MPSPSIAASRAGMRTPNILSYASRLLSAFCSLPFCFPDQGKGQKAEGRQFPGCVSRIGVITSFARTYPPIPLKPACSNAKGVQLEAAGDLQHVALVPSRPVQPGAGAVRARRRRLAAATASTGSADRAISDVGGSGEATHEKS